MSKSGAGGVFAAILTMFAGGASILRSCSKADDVARLGKFGSQIDNVDDFGRAGRYSRNANRMGDAAGYAKSANTYQKNPYALFEHFAETKARKVVEAEELAYLKKSKPEFAKEFEKLDQNPAYQADNLKHQKAIKDLKSKYLTKQDVVRFAKTLKTVRSILKVKDLYYSADNRGTDEDEELLSPKMVELISTKNSRTNSITIPKGFTVLNSVTCKNVANVWVDTSIAITLYHLPGSKDRMRWEFARKARGTYIGGFGRVSSTIKHGMDSTYVLNYRMGKRFGIIESVPGNSNYWIEIESDSLHYIRNSAWDLFEKITR